MIRVDFNMRDGQRFFVLFFVLILSITRTKAQDTFTPQSFADQNISLARLLESDLKQSSPDDQAQDSEQRWLFHVQATQIGMGQPGFRSPYKGTNSIAPDDDLRQTSNFNIFLGRVFGREAKFIWTSNIIRDSVLPTRMG